MRSMLYVFIVLMKWVEEGTYIGSGGAGEAMGLAEQHGGWWTRNGICGALDRASPNEE
jgi:hypothetical protein